MKNSKTFDFMFIDSDIAVNKAISKAVKNGAMSDNSLEYVILTELRYFMPVKDFAWTIVFYDVALGKPIEVVFINARNGKIAQ